MSAYHSTAPTRSCFALAASLGLVWACPTAALAADAIDNGVQPDPAKKANLYYIAQWLPGTSEFQASLANGGAVPWEQNLGNFVDSAWSTAGACVVPSSGAVEVGGAGCDSAHATFWLRYQPQNGWNGTKPVYLAPGNNLELMFFQLEGVAQDAQLQGGIICLFDRNRGSIGSYNQEWTSNPTCRAINGGVAYGEIAVDATMQSRFYFHDAATSTLGVGVFVMSQGSGKLRVYRIGSRVTHKANACLDDDSDGYGDKTAGCNDCNDQKAAVHPGATEDCNTPDDEDCSGSPSCCADSDGDQYGTGTVCGSQWCCKGPDCDDANNQINPGKPELCNDSADNDCDTKKDCADTDCNGSVCGVNRICSGGQCVCAPNCAGKNCGNDGCGGSCGTCPQGQACSNGVCTCTPNCVGKQCGDNGCGGSCGLCSGGLFCNPSGQCLPTCTPDCAGKQCGDDGCGGLCGTCAGGDVCAAGQCVPSCTPNCAGKQCGDNGCGGSCGSCGSGLVCNQNGQCTSSCTPACAGKACGPDGCGGSCGNCASGKVCNSAGQCVSSCTPNCAGKDCGDDGCLGSCGLCPPPQTCAFATGECVFACTPNCSGKQCGDDGCGGLCGTCGPGTQCSPDRQCVCAPQCFGKECGPNSCGGACGICDSGEACQGSSCVCAGSCVGRECGDDGCGVSCGTCPGGKKCVAAKCECVPDCTGKVCGNDGCGGNCGVCPGGLFCTAGVCTTNCTPDCTGKVCGDDGCGGQCGVCAATEQCVQGKCECAPNCSGKQCGPDGCGGTCGTCKTGTCENNKCTSEDCVPVCTGRDCGDDGCGGSCGSCGSGLCGTGGKCVSASCADAGKSCDTGLKGACAAGSIQCINNVARCIEFIVTRPPTELDCADGVDNDCDGIADGRDPDCPLCDADRDGFDGAHCGGSDCDDAAPFIHPGAKETCGDGIDNDCNNIIDCDSDIGTPCLRELDCLNGLCLKDADSGGEYCTTRCENADQCPAPLDGACAPINPDDLQGPHACSHSPGGFAPPVVEVPDAGEPTADSGLADDDAAVPETADAGSGADAAEPADAGPGADAATTADAGDIAPTPPDAGAPTGPGDEPDAETDAGLRDLGEPCVTDADCALLGNGVCRLESEGSCSGQRYCTQICDPASGDCAQGFTCAEDGQAPTCRKLACTGIGPSGPTLAGDTPSGRSGDVIPGGCACENRPSRGVPHYGVLMLLAAALVLRRRRAQVATCGVNTAVRR